MNANSLRDLVDIADAMPDLRARNVTHALNNIVILAILGVLAGADTWWIVQPQGCKSSPA